MSARERVSVVIPALNEAGTIAAVVEAVAEDHPHEILVVDADSTDATAANARRAGARVLNWREILPSLEPVAGKGESLWRGTAAATGDVVCFVDADLAAPRPGMVDALTAPFADPQVHLVKAAYPRVGTDGTFSGGRVTELTAKPLLRLHFPRLAEIDQPLAGEYAIRTRTARALPFVSGYGVEAGLLIDVAARFGIDAVSQVPLPPRRHRNRPLDELAPMALTVAATITERAGITASDDPLFPGQRPALDTLPGAGIG